MKTELIERKIFTIGYSIQVKLQVAKCESEENEKMVKVFSIEEVDYIFFDEFKPKEQKEIKAAVVKLLDLDYNTTLEKHIIDFIHSDEFIANGIIEELYNI